MSYSWHDSAENRGCGNWRATMQRVGIWYQQSGHHCVSSSSAPSAPSASSLPVPHQGLGVAVTTWDSLNYWGRNDQSQSVLLQSARNAVCNNSAMSNNPTMANATPSYLNGTFVGKLIDYGVVDHRSSPMGPSLSNLVVPQPSTTQDLNRCLSSSSLGAMAHQAAFAVPNQAATVQASAAPHVNGLLDLLASAAAQVSEQSNQSGGRSGESSSPNAVELFPTRQHQANALPQQIGGEGIEENSPRRNQFDVETVQPAQPVRHSNPKTAEGTAEVSTDAGICSRKTNGTTVAQGVQALLPGQKIGRMRKYNEQNKSYGAWEDIIVPANGCLTLELKRGGKIGLRTKMLSRANQQSISKAMRACTLYRQYTRCQVFHEPRFHVLLSSAAQCGTGYMYHGIRMKAFPIDLVPEVANYARELARQYNLPNDEWGIGVDLIIYKDGEDSIGWHADDTQDESIVVCVVVEAPGEPRPIYFRPNKRAKQLSDGDEEIQLDIGEGDAYDMDGVVQSGYEHCLPKKRNDKSHRFVLIFRHGSEASVPVDSGVAITEMARRRQASTPDANNGDVMPLLSQLRSKPPVVAFGHPDPNAVSEGSTYTRRYLYSSNAHRADQRGVNGNVKYGADSIVVSRQSPDCREEDGLQWLRYTSNRRQGGGALCLSYSQRLPLRVFRSSNLQNEFAPLAFDSTTSYRYDGLYVVTNAWDAAGNPMNRDNVDMPAGGSTAQYTFHLERLPRAGEAFLVEVAIDAQNTMGLDNLWRAVQHSHGRELTEFVHRSPKYHGNLPRLLDAVAATPENAQRMANSATCLGVNCTQLSAPTGAASPSPMQTRNQLVPTPFVPTHWAPNLLVGNTEQSDAPSQAHLAPVQMALEFVQQWRSMTQEEQRQRKEKKSPKKQIQLSQHALDELECFGISLMVAEYWRSSGILMTAGASSMLEKFTANATCAVIHDEARKEEDASAKKRTKRLKRKPRAANSTERSKKASEKASTTKVKKPAKRTLSDATEVEAGSKAQVNSTPATKRQKRQGQVLKATEKASATKAEKSVKRKLPVAAKVEAGPRAQSIKSTPASKRQKRQGQEPHRARQKPIRFVEEDGFESLTEALEALCNRGRGRAKKRLTTIKVKWGARRKHQTQAIGGDGVAQACANASSDAGSHDLSYALEPAQNVQEEGNEQSNVPATNPASAKCKRQTHVGPRRTSPRLNIGCGYGQDRSRIEVEPNAAESDGQSKHGLKSNARLLGSASTTLKRQTHNGPRRKSSRRLEVQTAVLEEREKEKRNAVHRNGGIQGTGEQQKNAACRRSPRVRQQSSSQEKFDVNQLGSRNWGERGEGEQQEKSATCRRSARCRQSLTTEKFDVGEHVFAWDRDVLYKGKILKQRVCGDGVMEYFVRFSGYKKCHDKWMNEDEVLKICPSSNEIYESFRVGDKNGKHDNVTQKDAENAVPIVGMGVCVIFDDGKKYFGTITKAKLHRSKKKLRDKEAFDIQISYNDGDVEDTTYPDRDICLIPS